MAGTAMTGALGDGGLQRPGREAGFARRRSVAGVEAGSYREVAGFGRRMVEWGPPKGWGTGRPLGLAGGCAPRGLLRRR